MLRTFHVLPHLILEYPLQVDVPILPMRKMRHKGMARVHMVSKEQSQRLNSGCLVVRPRLS